MYLLQWNKQYRIFVPQRRNMDNKLFKGTNIRQKKYMFTQSTDFFV